MGGLGEGIQDKSRGTETGASPRSSKKSQDKEEHQEKAPGLLMGRKSKLTPDLGERFCEAIRLGMNYKLACGYAGISEPTFYRWMQEAERQGGRKPQREFRDALKSAEAEGAAHSLAVINRAAKDGDWKAAAWILERRHDYRRDYAPVVMDTVTAPIEESPNPSTPKGREHIITEVSRLPEEFLLAALSRKVEVGEAK